MNFILYLIDNLLGRKIAIDASMSLYQFLIAVRQVSFELEKH